MLTNVGLVDGLDDGNQCRRLLLTEALLPAEKHRLDVQLQQDSFLWLWEVDSQHTAQGAATDQRKHQLKHGASQAFRTKGCLTVNRNTFPDQEQTEFGQ